MSGFDIEAVVAFARVVEHGSFTAAAAASGIPKSTLSRRVAELEEQLGARLLNRSSRRIALTESGAGFHERVAAALTQVEAAVRTIADQQEHPRGRVRLTAPFDIALDVAALLPDFLERFPDVNVVFDVSQRHVDLVAEGFDLALRGGAVRDPDLVARRVTDGCLVLAAAPAYLEKHGRPASLAELSKHRIVQLGGSEEVDWTLTREGVREQVQLMAAVSVNEVQTLAAAVLAGAGVGYLPRFTIADELDAGRIERVLPEWEGARTGLFLVVPSARHLPAKVRALRDFLLDRLPSYLGAGRAPRSER